jgi:pimeloyl-ACP methyl ester carboxylesterase
MTAMSTMTALRAIDESVPPVEVRGLRVESRLAQYPDGRRVAYCDLGDPDGATTVFYFHSGGSSRLEAALGHAAAASRGIRLVALDRPGAGRSSPLPGRTLADPAEDAASVAGLLGIRRYVVAGFSAGAPHALAAVLAAPRQVVGAILVNMTGDRFHPAWRGQPVLVRAMFAAMLGQTAWRFIWRQTLRQVERKAAAGDAMSGALAVILREGGRQGSGAADHEIDLCYRRPWALDWAALTRPVLALHGEKDPNLAFVRALERHAPRMRLRTMPGGHREGASPGAWDRLCDAALHLDSPDVRERSLGHAPFDRAFPN